MAIFRHLRAVAEFSLAVLCLWAAAYHTPAGALVRASSAWLFHRSSSARPLLSYYGGAGADTAQAMERAPRPPRGLMVRGELPPLTALGYGAYSSLMQQPSGDRWAARALARGHGQDPAALEDPEQGPAQLARLLGALEKEHGSQEAAVLSLFCGPEPARYALERARAEGGAVTLEALRRALPPSLEEEAALTAQALSLGVAYGLSWPVPEGSAISSPFGMRQHPVLGEPRMHTGIDIPVPEGTAVHAAAAGVVRRASEDRVNGKVLVIDHGFGVSTAYCHNSRLEVTEGQVITRGMVLSRSGSTGRSTGPHLHFQLELSGTPVDPLRYRPARALVAGPDVR